MACDNARLPVARARRAVPRPRRRGAFKGHTTIVIVAALAFASASCSGSASPPTSSPSQGSAPECVSASGSVVGPTNVLQVVSEADVQEVIGGPVGHRRVKTVAPFNSVTYTEMHPVVGTDPVTKRKWAPGAAVVQLRTEPIERAAFELCGAKLGAPTRVDGIGDDALITTTNQLFVLVGNREFTVSVVSHAVGFDQDGAQRKLAETVIKRLNGTTPTLPDAPDTNPPGP
jgi:hypothetical protein